MNDEDSFQNLLGEDVEPLRVEKRVNLIKDSASEASLKHRRAAAETEQEAAEDPLVGEPVSMVAPMDLITFRRPGVQHGVFRNLRLGHYSIEARLDLHRMTVDRARREVYQFVRDCLSHDVRMALITHGKGEGRATPALLKSHVAHWLPQIEEILAFHTAQKKHGGYGATYVLMKKSDSKKTHTRERLRKRLPE